MAEHHDNGALLWAHNMKISLSLYVSTISVCIVFMNRFQAVEKKNKTCLGLRNLTTRGCTSHPPLPSSSNSTARLLFSPSAETGLETHLATMLPFLPFPLTPSPLVPQVSRFSLEPQMDHLHHLRSF